MRVLQIINNLEPAGAERLLSDLLPRFGDRGCTPEVYLLRSTDSWLEREVRARFVVHDGGQGAPYSPAAFYRLVQHLRCNHTKYDVVHVHLYPAQLFAAIASAFVPGLPMIATEHNTTNRRRRFGFRILDRCMYHRFAQVTGVSSAVSHELASWIGQKPGPVVWNGVELSRFASAASGDLKEELGTKRPLILSIGRFHQQKDHATAIRALASIPEAGLVLVGKGTEMQNCRELAVRVGVQDRVWFLGQRSDIPRLIAGCDVYLQCSRWEGFGIAVVEAMAGGLPVVGTNVDGFRQVVGTAGLFFSPGDEVELARHLVRVLEDEGLRSELSTRSRSRAADFDIERTADEYCHLFANALQMSTQVGVGAHQHASTGAIE